MDQYLAEIAVAVISGIVGIIIVVIQRKQDKVITKIDQKTTFLEKEKGLKQRIAENEKEAQNIMYEIMLLILDTNLTILQNTTIDGEAMVSKDNEVFTKSEELKKRLDENQKQMTHLNEEYQLVLDMISAYQTEISKIESGKK